MKIVDDKIFFETLAYLDTKPHGEVRGGYDKLALSSDSKKLFEELAACIRSGQVPQEAVPSMLTADPAFADFYQALSERLNPES